MKKIVKSMCIILIGLLSTSIFSYAQENELTLKVNKEKVAIEDEILVNIMAENSENIAGANIQINYDGQKMKLITKKILLEEENIINIQCANRDLQDLDKLQDGEGTSKIIFGFKKNKALINEKQKALATFIFKAKEVGEGRIALGIESQLIQEKNSNGALDYVYTNPKIQQEDTIIYIENKGKISGNVSTSDGFNIDNTKIKLLKDATELQSITLKNNTYMFTNVEDGSYTIIAEKQGYETFQKDIMVVAGQNFLLDFELQRIKEDIDRNGKIELEDLVFMASRFGLEKDEAGWHDDADVNKDHIIDMRDILFISRTLE
ncbi:carboxypeptidase regulatory-like domain-containing protein [Marinisporobacter balticus]|uniref:Carboxypeptidase family protein n=1 Tax=Marinisporobacter balticus TaxID=2018667 RepID=A0A4R2KXK2_9FIRM|nr:carboxypeptidase regulatory-like domain-containing protein [Marinisporobacter balticus]TCO78754.1 carboxypeptidase family protein [Marinisporobacter balticus]